MHLLLTGGGSITESRPDSRVKLDEGERGVTHRAARTRCAREIRFARGSRLRLPLLFI